MPVCTRMSGCPLFKTFRLKASLVVWTMRYCEGDFAKCARLRLANEGKPIPLGLLHSGMMLTVPLEAAELKDTGDA